jgi:DNA polymerase III sliding clamp (beta) subunit (PCNA family)
VKSDLDINRCVPGDLLIRALASFAGDSVMIQPTKEKNEILVSSGRAKLKMPCMTLEDFPFEEPKEDGHAIDITDAMLKGIERCLISVGRTTRIRLRWESRWMRRRGRPCSTRRTTSRSPASRPATS